MPPTVTQTTKPEYKNYCENFPPGVRSPWLRTDEALGAALYELKVSAAFSRGKKSASQSLTALEQCPAEAQLVVRVPPTEFLE